MTSRDRERSSRDPNTLKIQYLENGWRQGLRSKGHQSETVYGGSNGHVIDNVTLTLRHQHRDPSTLTAQYLEHSGIYAI